MSGASSLLLSSAQEGEELRLLSPLILDTAFRPDLVETVYDMNAQAD